MNHFFAWEAQTLHGNNGDGLIKSESSTSAKRELQQKGYFQAKLTVVPEKLQHSALVGSDILELLNSLLLMLDAGVPIGDSLEMLVHDNKSILLRYILYQLRDSLHNGSSLGIAFDELKPLFSDFFVSMIVLGEKTGDLRGSLHSLEAFYENLESRQEEIKRITRYPKVVISITILITLGIVTFIIPMFENIYSMFEGNLPITTKFMVSASKFIRFNWPYLVLTAGVLAFWANLPYIGRFHPWLIARTYIEKVIQSREDPFIYAHAMKILLENGHPVKSATLYAAGCMSSKNQRHGISLVEQLNAGRTFTEAYRELSWFPLVFTRFLTSAEKAGKLQVGFEQIFLYLNKQRTNQFNKWSKYLEPSMMLLLGSIILVVLLSIYLPIFELGNQIK